MRHECLEMVGECLLKQVTFGQSHYFFEFQIMCLGNDIVCGALSNNGNCQTELTVDACACGVARTLGDSRCAVTKASPQNLCH